MNDPDQPLDILHILPRGIIENILCLVPIKEAAGTSVLSREWRYIWTKIPKLVFNEVMFGESPDENKRLSDVEQTFQRFSEWKKMSPRCKLFYAIYQVLLVHEGPILEFTLSMSADESYVEIDQLINHLSRRNTVRKLTLQLTFGLYRLPSSIFSLHRLTDLYLEDCDFKLKPIFSGFSSLTTLCLNGVEISKKTLLHLLSSCPSLKSFSLLPKEHNYRYGNDTLTDLSKCLLVLEHFTINCWGIEWFAEDAVPRKLPTSLVNLKYFCVGWMCFLDKLCLPFTVLLMRSSPNLEKIKLSAGILLPSRTYYYEREGDFEDADAGKDYSDIWLEHLNELEIGNFANLKIELKFVKLILAKSPVLKKVRISLDHRACYDEELKTLKMLVCSPHASPLVEIVVQRLGVPY